MIPSPRAIEMCAVCGEIASFWAIPFGHPTIHACSIEHLRQAWITETGHIEVQIRAHIG